MSNSSFPLKIKISDNLLFQQISGECVLLDLDSENYFGLDQVAASFWELISTNEDTEKAIQQLLVEYEVDENTLRRDISKLLTDLKELKLITFN